MKKVPFEKTERKEIVQEGENDQKIMEDQENPQPSFLPSIRRVDDSAADIN